MQRKDLETSPGEWASVTMKHCWPHQGSTSYATSFLLQSIGAENESLVPCSLLCSGQRYQPKKGQSACLECGNGVVNAARTFCSESSSNSVLEQIT